MFPRFRYLAATLPGWCGLSLIVVALSAGLFSASVEAGRRHNHRQDGDNRPPPPPPRPPSPGAAAKPPHKPPGHSKPKPVFAPPQPAAPDADCSQTRRQADPGSDAQSQAHEDAGVCGAGSDPATLAASSCRGDARARQGRGARDAGVRRERQRRSAYAGRCPAAGQRARGAAAGEIRSRQGGPQARSRSQRAHHLAWRQRAAAAQQLPQERDPHRQAVTRCAGARGTARLRNSGAIESGPDAHPAATAARGL